MHFVFSPQLAWIDPLGELYSVKIMWPRHAEERARNRHTGFVCFMNRRDAEDAMHACNESDPFRSGHVLKLGWGKDVKRKQAAGEGPLKTASIGAQLPSCAISTTPPNATALVRSSVEHVSRSAESELVARDNQHGSVPSQSDNKNNDIPRNNPVRVVMPPDPRRAQFITTVASFVAKDGSELEQLVMQREINNPAFAFLTWPRASGHNHRRLDEVTRQEHIFYKWRIYSFCHGDGFSTWRTEPFVLFSDHRGIGAQLWIPPPIDPEASRREQEMARQREESIARQKQQRRFLHARRDYVTGRQLERVRAAGGNSSKKKEVLGGAQLDEAEWMECDRLFREQLCASQQAICEAMAFCFEKSAASSQISSILKDLLLETGHAIDVETRIARLYLLSDVLFNSQQPGVRNAFRYRDAIEQMAPEVMSSFQETRNSVGRMTQHKLNSAVRSVLAAWTRWGVYNPTFLNELDALYEGREIETSKDEANKSMGDTAYSSSNERAKLETEEIAKAEDSETVRPISQGRWSSVDTKDAENELNECSNHETLRENEADGTPLDDADGESIEDDDGADGEPIDDDLDGEPTVDREIHGKDIATSSMNALAKNFGVKGEQREHKKHGSQGSEPSDADGEPIDNGDIDGEPFDPDGEPIEADEADGKSFDPDGEPI